MKEPRINQTKNVTVSTRSNAQGFTSDDLVTNRPCYRDVTLCCIRQSNRVKIYKNLLVFQSTKKHQILSQFAPYFSNFAREFALPAPHQYRPETDGGPAHVTQKPSVLNPFPEIPKHPPSLRLPKITQPIYGGDPRPRRPEITHLHRGRTWRHAAAAARLAGRRPRPWRRPIARAQRHMTRPRTWNQT